MLILFVFITRLYSMILVLIAAVLVTTITSLYNITIYLFNHYIMKSAISCIFKRLESWNNCP